MDLFKDKRAREQIYELQSQGFMTLGKVMELEAERTKPLLSQNEAAELKELRIYCDNLLRRIESIEANYHHNTLNRFDVLEQKIDQLKKKLDEPIPLP
jgi:hypothetical protein